MATRAIIGRLDPRSGGWEGIYVNNDGEPEQAAPRIYRQVEQAFGGNVDKAYDHFVSRHPGGWHSLGDIAPQNVCYCHPADRAALGPFVASAAISTLDWIYVLRPEGLEIRRWHQGTITTLPWNGHLKSARVKRILMQALELNQAA